MELDFKYDLKYSELLLEELNQSTSLSDSMNILRKRQVFLSFEKGFIILNIIKLLFKQYNSKERKYHEFELFICFLQNEKVINMKNSVGTYFNKTLWDSFLEYSFNDISKYLEN